MNIYTPQDKLEFQRNQKWIAFESIFKSLCDYYGQMHSTKEINEIVKETVILVESLLKRYPMQEIKDEPFPTPKNNPTIGRIPNICPECGASVKHKTGMGKKGSYDFYGCSAYPKCRWTYQSKK